MKKKEIELGQHHLASTAEAKKTDPSAYNIYNWSASDPGDWDTVIGTIDHKEVVLPPFGIYTLIIDYPVTRKYVATILSGKRGLTRDALVLVIAKHYKQMYDTENDAVGDPGNIPGMFNRATSDGPYGIWGHGLGDLILHTADIKGDKITLGIDS